LIDLVNKKGIEYDPILIKVFVNMMGLYPIGTLVVLDTKELAIVVQTNSDTAYLDRPEVKLITDSTGKKINGEIVDLTEIGLKTNSYKRTILKSLDPKELGIDTHRYL